MRGVHGGDVYYANNSYVLSLFDTISSGIVRW